MREESGWDDPQISELGSWKGGAHSLVTAEGGAVEGEEVMSSFLAVMSLGYLWAIPLVNGQKLARHTWVVAIS